MALNGNALGTLMKQYVDTYVAGLSDTEKQNVDDSIREDIFQEMGKAIVAHIQANAVVNSTGTATGVTTGGSSVPCTTVGSIT